MHESSCGALCEGRWQVSREKRQEEHPQSEVAPAPYLGPERRDKPRLNVPFPAMVRGVNANGEAFETDTHLNNLSRGGLNLKLGQPVEPGMKLFILIQLAAPESQDAEAPRVAVRGNVLRVERQPDGPYSVAVAITQYRFL